MQQAQNVCPDDKVSIVAGINIEMAVIHSASKDRIIGRDSDNTISVFDHMLHVAHFSSLGTENHPPIKIAVGWGSKCDGRDGDNCDRPNRFWRSLKVSATK